MGKSFIQEETLTNIANAIREKNLSSTKYKPSEMPAAILALTSFSDAQKQSIIDALSQKGVDISINELTLDNIATYILEIKIDSNIEEYIKIRTEYNELISFAQEKLNLFNETQDEANLYPTFNENEDISVQIQSLKEEFNLLKNFILEKLGGI